MLYRVCLKKLASMCCSVFKKVDGIMKKRLMVLSALATFSMFTHAESSLAVTALQKHVQWGLVQPGTMCVESYQFLPNGEVKVESNQERVTGKYSFISKENSFELPAVVIAFETDNQKADCGGSTANQAGTSTTNFLKRESDQKIYFCLDSLGKNCPVYLRPEK